MNRIIFATGNAGKMKEIREIPVYERSRDPDGYRGKRDDI